MTVASRAATRSMPTQYTIQQGDCLSSIARAFGFDDWKTIYNDPANAQFKQDHPNPNLIFPGEDLTIPDLDPGSASGSTENRHTFELKLDHTLLRIIAMDMKDQAFASKPYKLTVGSQSPLTGNTDGTGLLEVEIDPAEKTGKLELFIHGQNEPPVIWNLLLGHLDPAKQKSGQQARLNNLGFESGKVDNIDGPITQGAVKRFQTKYSLKVDGIVGQETRPKIEEVYGC